MSLLKRFKLSSVPDVSGQRPSVVIEPQRGFFDLDLKALLEYRDLFFFLVWRDVKARYSQSVLGIGWAVVQPVFSMVVYTVVFGSVAKISSDGHPYALFSYVGLVPWTYFANALTESTGSLVRNASMLSKVYFPRLILPFTSVLGKLVDFDAGDPFDDLLPGSAHDLDSLSTCSCTDHDAVGRRYGNVVNSSRHPV
jgi:hypothetical protein